MSDRSLWATLRTLALAFLNATLILAALVLWLGWRTADAVHEASDDVRLALAELTPLQAGLVEVKDEVAGLRADIAGLRTASAGGNAALPEDLVLRLEQLDARLTAAAGSVETLMSEPEALIDRAIDATAEEMKQAVADMRGCTLPGEF